MYWNIRLLSYEYCILVLKICWLIINSITRNLFFFLLIYLIFVFFFFFFLAEYGSIVLMCILTSILFLGGYLLLDYLVLLSFLDTIFSNLLFMDWLFYLEKHLENVFNNPIFEGLLYGLSLGLKSSIMIFIFIWARASFPRIRFDQLMAFCWTVLLPILFALIILIPCILFSYNTFPININLF